jgi:hypothetical protein
MNGISNKAEQIIKGLIDANLKIGFGTHTGMNSTLYFLKYENQEFDITLHRDTKRQVIIDYFYQQIIKLEFPNE